MKKENKPNLEIKKSMITPLVYIIDYAYNIPLKLSGIDYETASYFKKTHMKNKLLDNYYKLIKDFKKALKEDFDHVYSSAFSNRNFIYDDIEFNYNYFHIFCINYCNMIRFAEKLNLYSNNANDHIYVESELYSENSCNFVIRNNSNNIDHTILIKCTEKEDTVSQTLLKIIEISIERYNGKQMKNKIIIVNGYVKVNNISDTYLFLSILNSIYNNIINANSQLCNKLYNLVEQYDDRWYDL